MTVLFKVVNK